jgi:predicted TIM-barrel fold metal-dependent hydrolase
MIDTHVHHWDLSRFRYPWLDDPAFDELRKDYLPTDYRADVVAGAVAGWVHIQAEVDHQLDPWQRLRGWHRSPRNRAQQA